MRYLYELDPIPATLGMSGSVEAEDEEDARRQVKYMYIYSTLAWSEDTFNRSILDVMTTDVERPSQNFKTYEDFQDALLELIQKHRLGSGEFDYTSLEKS